MKTITDKQLNISNYAVCADKATVQTVKLITAKLISSLNQMLACEMPDEWAGYSEKHKGGGIVGIHMIASFRYPSLEVELMQRMEKCIDTFCGTVEKKLAEMRCSIWQNKKKRKKEESHVGRIMFSDWHRGVDLLAQ